MKPLTMREYKLLPDNTEDETMAKEDFTRARSWDVDRLCLCICALGILLAASILTNLAFVFQRVRVDTGESCIYKSPYAELESYNIPREIYPHDEYVNEANLTKTSLAWEALSGDPGVVALSDSFVASKKLPTAMRYPWDNTKGVYLLQGFHNLHCMRTIYRSIMAYHNNQPQPIALVHILHCLDELRQDVICHADDTPRYAGLQNPPGTGKGQVKMCRDWGALEDWASDNTACFRHEDEVADRMVNRFKSCPDGSQPWLGLEGLEPDVPDVHWDK